MAPGVAPLQSDQAEMEVRPAWEVSLEHAEGCEKAGDAKGAERWMRVADEQSRQTAAQDHSEQARKPAEVASEDESHGHGHANWRRRSVGVVLVIGAALIWAAVVYEFFGGGQWQRWIGAEPVCGPGTRERHGACVPRPLTDEDLDRAVAEFDSRCRTKAASSGVYDAYGVRHVVAEPAYCTCVLVAVAAGQPRQRAQITCDQVARAGEETSPSETGDSGSGHEEERRARILAEARASTASFSALRSRAEKDAWVGPEGLALDYRDLERAVWRHVGRRVRFRGTVFNVDETHDAAYIQAFVCRGGRDCNLSAIYPTTRGTRIRRGDDLWIYGFVLDEDNYTSQAGHELRVPRIAMVGGILFQAY